MKHHSGFTAKFIGSPGGTFICDGCGKRTRDTGENASCRLCPLCYYDNVIENMESDGYSKEEIDQYIETKTSASYRKYIGWKKGE